MAQSGIDMLSFTFGLSA